MRHRGGRWRTEHGFTLVELLTVLAIIAILFALLLPVLAYFRRRGREAATLANIKDLCLALECYSQRSNHLYPIQPSGSGNVTDSGSGSYNPGFYQTHCAAVGTMSDGGEDNSALIRLLVQDHYLPVGSQNLNASGSLIDYFGKPIIIRFMVTPVVNAAGNPLPDQLNQRVYAWSYGADNRNWINATPDYSNNGLPNYDAGEAGRMEQPPVPQDDSLTSWR